MKGISHRPFQLITLGTLGLGIASFLPQVKAAKIGSPLRIFALTLATNWVCEVVSGLCNKNENVFAKKGKDWQELKTSPSVIKTIPRAMLETAICGIVLAAAASVGKTKPLTGTSKVFTIGLPLAALAQFIIGQVFYHTTRQCHGGGPMLLLMDKNSKFGVNEWVAEKHAAISVCRVISTAILTRSCIAVRGGLIGLTGK